MKRLIALTILALFLASCATGEGSYRASVREGNYDLIILEPGDGGPAIAILDRLDDPMEIAAEDPGQVTAHIKDLPRKEAIRRADDELPGSGVVMREVYSEDDLLAGYQAYPPPDMPPTLVDPDNDIYMIPNLFHIRIGEDPRGRRVIKIKILPLAPKSQR